jgi:hypothetical protein
MLWIAEQQSSPPESLETTTSHSSVAAASKLTAPRTPLPKASSGERLHDLRIPDADTPAFGDRAATPSGAVARPQLSGSSSATAPTPGGVPALLNDRACRCGGCGSHADRKQPSGHHPGLLLPPAPTGATPAASTIRWERKQECGTDDCFRRDAGIRERRDCFHRLTVQAASECNVDSATARSVQLYAPQPARRAVWCRRSSTSAISSTRSGRGAA